MENKPRKIYTLCFLQDDKRMLLGMKKKGLGIGRWNGFGGKVEAGETIEDAAKREFVEECGLVVTSIRERGVLDFEFRGKPGILEVHIFEAREYSGELKETEEMKPQWFDLTHIPYNEMWQDDQYWLPLLLQGKSFKGRILLDEKDQILEKAISEF